jgi:hypothetical protein
VGLVIRCADDVRREVNVLNTGIACFWILGFDNGEEERVVGTGKEILTVEKQEQIQFAEEKDGEHVRVKGIGG